MHHSGAAAIASRTFSMFDDNKDVNSVVENDFTFRIHFNILLICHNNIFLLVLSIVHLVHSRPFYASEQPRQSVTHRQWCVLIGRSKHKYQCISRQMFFLSEIDSYYCTSALNG